MENLTKEQKAEQAKADKAATAADNKVAKQLEAMQKSMTDMQELINSQAKALAGLKTGKEDTKVVELPTIPKESVKSAKKELKWAVPHFRFNEKYYTAEDAALDQDLIDEIVAIEGQGILVEVH